mgnify:FL=1|jgi:triE protein
MFYLADKIQTPLKSVIWICAGFAIIIAFIKNSGGILTLAVERLRSYPRSEVIV